MFVILLIILALILINGFFAAAEMALVSIEPSEIHHLESTGNKNAKTLKKLSQDSTTYLSTIQVAITLAGFMSSAFAGTKLSGNLILTLDKFGISMSENAAVIIITITLSFLTLVLGELVPKRIALSHPIKFALFVAPIIQVMMILFKPFVWLLSVMTKAITWLFGINKTSEKNKLTEEKIKKMIVYGNIKGLYQEEETEMLQRIFRFDDLTVDMIMTPIQNVTFLDINDTKEKIIKIMVESRYSRIPVFNENVNKIMGVIHIKDVALRLNEKDFKKININDLIRDPLIVNKNTNINDLMRNMRQSSQHLAFIIDNNENTLGIVTLEDIVEEITGEIYDEHDVTPKSINDEDKFTYIVDGETKIIDLNSTLGFDVIPHSSDDETICDYIEQIKGNLNKQNIANIIEIPLGTIEILKVDKGKASQVRFLISSPDSTSRTIK